MSMHGEWNLPLWPVSVCSAAAATRYESVNMYVFGRPPHTPPWVGRWVRIGGATWRTWFQCCVPVWNMARKLYSSRLEPSSKMSNHVKKMVLFDFNPRLLGTSRAIVVVAPSKKMCHSLQVDACCQMRCLWIKEAGQICTVRDQGLILNIMQPLPFRATIDLISRAGGGLLPHFRW